MANDAPKGAISLLAVDGIDGSGKSVFAEHLVEALGAAGVATALLRVDDFRQAVDWRRDGRSEADAYHDDYYDLSALDQVARTLRTGAPQATIPVFDANLERRTGARAVQMARGVAQREGEGDGGGGPDLASGEVADAVRAIVVEGVFALRVAEVRAGAAVIYLKVSFGEARRRILARDTTRGRSAENVLHRIDERYFPAQERYMREHDPVGRADVLIDHERLGQPAVERFDATRLPPTVEVALRGAVLDFAASPTVK